MSYAKDLSLNYFPFNPWPNGQAARRTDGLASRVKRSSTNDWNPESISGLFLRH